MAESQYFQKMEANLRRLEGLFLPKASNPLNQYSADEQDVARSFRVFAHAEIEHYLESKCVEFAKWLVSEFEATGKCHSNLLAFTIFCGDVKKIPDSEPDLQRLERDLGVHAHVVLAGTVKVSVGVIKQALNAYISACQIRNQGIRTKNIFAMLLPLGIDHRQIDPTWISSLDSMGSNRGDNAHKGLGSIMVISDPFAERAAVDRIVNGQQNRGQWAIQSLRDIDLLLQGIQAGNPVLQPRRPSFFARLFGMS